MWCQRWVHYKIDCEELVAVATPDAVTLRSSSRFQGQSCSSRALATRHPVCERVVRSGDGRRATITASARLARAARRRASRLETR